MTVIESVMMVWWVFPFQLVDWKDGKERTHHWKTGSSRYLSFPFFGKTFRIFSVAHQSSYPTLCYFLWLKNGKLTAYIVLPKLHGRLAITSHVSPHISSSIIHNGIEKLLHTNFQFFPVIDFSTFFPKTLKRAQYFLGKLNTQFFSINGEKFIEFDIFYVWKICCGSNKNNNYVVNCFMINMFVYVLCFLIGNHELDLWTFWDLMITYLRDIALGVIRQF